MDDSTVLTEIPFNHKPCDVPGYETCWVRFKTSGYPRKLRREWDKAGPNRTLEIITRYVEAWHILDLNGREIGLGDVRPLMSERATTESLILDPQNSLVEKRMRERELDALPDPLGETEDALSVWLIRTFQAFWITELPFPRKNSLPPSTTR